MATTVDNAFKVIPRNSTCFYIWRIEKMQVMTVPRDQYGKFFTGDSYIIFSVTESGSPGGVACKTREAKSGEQLEMHVHFWLGKETSADEAGVAAYKTVELDDWLGGAPVQHREVEGRESGRFLAYFTDGIRILQGGVASGFRHVDNVVEPRLYQVKGRRRPVVRQMPTVSWDHINDGDAYVLQVPEAVFVWTGRNANHMEKLQSAKTAQKLRGEAPKPISIVFVEDGKERDLPDAERTVFNRHLELKKRVVKPAAEAPSDEEQEKRVSCDIRLYRCSDEDGTLRVTEVKTGPLSQNDLISDDSFIVDVGEQGIWVWIGRRASGKERVEAMRNAQGFLKKKGYAHHTHIARVVDGGEPLEFKSLFRNWKDRFESGAGGTGGPRYTQGRIARTIQTKFDASTLHDTPQLAAQTQLVDDGSGKGIVFLVRDHDASPLLPRRHGVFYDGNSYIVRYTYEANGREHILLYYWLGAKSSAEDQGTAALKTVELDDEVDGRAVQVRVVQGKEPAHFMAIFQGKMIIFRGEAPREDGVEHDMPDLPILMQVRGRSVQDTVSMQVELRAASLNSNDVFVLMGSQSGTYVWCGQGSTGDEREMAKQVAGKAGKGEMHTVFEGQEKDDFWDAIGGKEPYANDKRLAESNEARPARLFQCSNASGCFKVEEITHFNQSDLVEEDMMLLDAWDCLFLWIGNMSNKDEQKLSQVAAREYLQTDPAGREGGVPIFLVKQGSEPPNFTGFFGVWDRSLWNNNKTFDELREELMADSPQIMLQKETEDENSAGDAFEDYPKFPLDVLRLKDPDALPDGVDPTLKEVHLSTEDFYSLFQMKPNEFSSLPNWKKQSMKKAAGIF